MKRILSRTVSLALIAFGLVFAYGVFRLSQLPPGARESGSMTFAVVAVVAAVVVLVLGVLVALFYGVVRLAGKAWRGE